MAAALPVLEVIIALAVILLILGMLVGNLLKERPPVKPDSLITREMKRIDREGKR